MFNNEERRTATMRKTLSLLMTLALPFCASLHAAQEVYYMMPQGMKLEKSGALSIDSISFSATILDKNGKKTSQSLPGLLVFKDYPQIVNDSFIIKTKMPTPEKGTVVIDENCKADLKANTVVQTIKFIPDGPMEAEAAGIAVLLPQDTMSGQRIDIGEESFTLPEDYADQWCVYQKEKATKVVVSLPSGQLLIEGQFDFQVYDDRRNGLDEYLLMFRAPKGSGQIRDNLDLSLNYTLKAMGSTPIDISQAVNVGFADDVKDDQKGGWTDQGQENDLYMMKTGMLRSAGIDFNVINPDNNRGRAAIVLNGGNHGSHFPDSARVEMDGEKFRFLYFLHSMAWGVSDKSVIGRITVEYKDGSTTEHSVLGGDDIGDWWGPAAKPRALLAWAEKNRSATVGLFMSKYKIEDKPIKKIDIESTRKAIWMIAGITGSDCDVPLETKATATIADGNDWKPVTCPKSCLPDSILDFSFLQDAPAGKYGRIIRDGNKLVFEESKDKQIRLFGTVLKYSAAFMDKDYCDRLVKYLAACGYNAVRISSVDDILCDKVAANGSTNLDKDKLDQLDYFISALKEKGIYVSLDLYACRILREGEIPETTTVVKQEVKYLFPLLDSAMKNWEDYVKNLMNHENPYTKTVWKNETALFSLTLVADNNLYQPLLERNSEVQAIFQTQFEQWLKTQNGGIKERDQAEQMQIFFMNKQKSAVEKMTAFLKAEGVKALISDGISAGTPLALSYKTKSELIEAEAKWDAPVFMEKPGLLPSRFTGKSSVSRFAKNPGQVFAARLLDRPFIAEYAFSYPSQFRNESGLLTGAYASLQNWNGIYRYCHSMNMSGEFHDMALTYYSTALDPINILSDRIAALLFLRGDLKSSQTVLPYILPDEKSVHVGTAYPETIRISGLRSMTGSLSAEQKLPQGTRCIFTDNGKITAKTAIPYIDPGQGLPLPDGQFMQDLFKQKLANPETLNMQKGTAVSDTGEISIDRLQNLFKISSPLTEAMIIAPKLPIQNSGAMSVVNEGLTSALFCLSSLDGKPIKDSQKMILFHITDAQNSKLKFSGKNMTILEKGGTLPVLARKGNATVTISGLNMDKIFKVWATDMTGKRLFEMKSEVFEGGVLNFYPAVIKDKNIIMTYEIIAE